MSELDFSIEEIVTEKYAAAPTMTARLHIQETTGAVVHAIALRCQIRIEPQRRPYDESEAHRLADIFGGRERWKETLRPFLWTHATTLVQGFTGETTADLPIPVSYDFEVAAAKYLHALRDGMIPLVFMFSGTVFTRGGTGFQVEQVPWHKDVQVQLAASVWHETMDIHFPGEGWMRVSRDTIDALAAYKSQRGLLDWDDTIWALLRETQPAADAAKVAP